MVLYCFNVFDVFTRRWLGYMFSPSARSASAVQSVTNAVAGLPPEQVKDMRVRCDNGTQYKSGEFRAAMKVLGLAVEYIWVSTPQQNGHIESFHNTLKRDYVRPHDYESYQDAEAHLARAIKDYNGNRVHSSIGWLLRTSSSGSGKGTIGRGLGRHDDGSDRAPDPPN